MTTIEKQEVAMQSLKRIQESTSEANVPFVIAAFANRGIAVEDIKPKENVLTFNAWKALGRYVKKGEKGVKITTMREEKDDKGTVTRRYPMTACVFHLSQTESY